MRDDLLHAQASVDWAETNLPSLRKRTNVWLKNNIHLTIVEQPVNCPNNVVVAREKEPLPFAFQVEAGAYINAIRSSLDILACTLADRHCQALRDDTYFPVASSSSNFAAGNYKGNKFVKALPAKERAIIESLKPYKGGNGLLYPLHLLDIVRKHQRLMAVDIQPAQIKVSGWRNATKAFTPISGPGYMRSGTDETVIGIIAKGVEKPQIEITPQISLDETTYLPHREIVATLYDFANLAKAIIRNFDY
jgi:hypothetical protein